MRCRSHGDILWYTCTMSQALAPLHPQFKNLKLRKKNEIVSEWWKSILGIMPELRTDRFVCPRSNRHPRPPMCILLNVNCSASHRRNDPSYSLVRNWWMRPMGNDRITISVDSHNERAQCRPAHIRPGRWLATKSPLRPVSIWFRLLLRAVDPHPSHDNWLHANPFDWSSLHHLQRRPKKKNNQLAVGGNVLLATLAYLQHGFSRANFCFVWLRCICGTWLWENLILWNWWSCDQHPEVANTVCRSHSPDWLSDICRPFSNAWWGGRVEKHICNSIGCRGGKWNEEIGNCNKLFSVVACLPCHATNNLPLRIFQCQLECPWHVHNSHD